MHTHGINVCITFPQYICMCIYIYTNRSSICMCIYIHTSTYYGRFVYKYICVICIHKYIKLIMIEL